MSQHIVIASVKPTVCNVPQPGIHDIMHPPWQQFLLKLRNVAERHKSRKNSILTIDWDLEFWKTNGRSWLIPILVQNFSTWSTELREVHEFSIRIRRTRSPPTCLSETWPNQNHRQTRNKSAAQIALDKVLNFLQKATYSTDFSGSCKRWYVVYNHPIGSIYRLYTRYILPPGGWYSPDHLLPEPE